MLNQSFAGRSIALLGSAITTTAMLMIFQTPSSQEMLVQFVADEAAQIASFQDDERCRPPQSDAGTTRPCTPRPVRSTPMANA